MSFIGLSEVEIHMANFPRAIKEFFFPFSLNFSQKIPPSSGQNLHGLELEEKNATLKKNQAKIQKKIKGLMKVSFYVVN